MTAAHGEQHANVRFTSGAHRVHVNSMPRIWLAQWPQPGWCWAALTTKASPALLLPVS